jgi:hypothetical protein
MKLQTIKKAITINSPAKTVWDVLLNEKYTREWNREFAEDMIPVTDWSQGAKAVFGDKMGNGLIARVSVNNPNKELTLQYIGNIVGGKEDYDSEEAKLYKGGKESYKLSENNGITSLDISSDMDEKYFEFMSKAWDNALQTIKKLAESQLTPA